MRTATKEATHKTHKGYIHRDKTCSVPMMKLIIKMKTLGLGIKNGVPSTPVLWGLELSITSIKSHRLVCGYFIERSHFHGLAL
uniref:Uncharacterized protein n=1 Tax=Rhizophora mucronata TaxID=61149 RepID=A0A2P2IR93_RHIMU